MRTLRKPLVVEIMVTILFLGCLSGCTSSQHDKNKEDKSSINAQADTFLFPGIEYLLPSPSEVLLTTLTEDITYTQNLTAPLGIEKKSILSQFQALILGVYITDLSYHIMFQEHQASTSCFTSIRELSESIGIGSALYYEYFKRVENNSNSIDSIDVIYRDFSQNTFLTIESTGNKELLSLVALGSGIEAMYLSYASIDFKTIKNILLSNFTGHRVIFENYYKNFLNYGHNKPELNSFLKDIKNIYSMFGKNVVKRNNTTVSKVKDSHFDINDRKENTYDEKAIKMLGDSIVIVRNNLINLKYQ